VPSSCTCPTQRDEQLVHAAALSLLLAVLLFLHLLLLLQALLGWNNLQEDTDTSQLRLRGLRKKVTDVLRQARTDRQLCLILSLSVVLVVLTVVALL